MHARGGGGAGPHTRMQATFVRPIARWPAYAGTWLLHAAATWCGLIMCHGHVWLPSLACIGVCGQTRVCSALSVWLCTPPPPPVAASGKCLRCLRSLVSHWQPLLLCGCVLRCCLLSALCGVRLGDPLSLAQAASLGALHVIAVMICQGLVEQQRIGRVLAKAAARMPRGPARSSERAAQLIAHTVLGRRDLGARPLYTGQGQGLRLS